MNNICTSIEQSKKLIELEIDVNTADMFWLTTDKPRVHVLAEDLEKYSRWDCMPAWSLSALIDLMPDKILINNESYYLSFTKERVSFRGPVTWDGQKAKSFEMDNIFDAVFEMVCWLKENGKL